MWAREAEREATTDTGALVDTTGVLDQYRDHSPPVNTCYLSYINTLLLSLQWQDSDQQDEAGHRRQPPPLHHGGDGGVHGAEHGEYDGEIVEKVSVVWASVTTVELCRVSIADCHSPDSPDHHQHTITGAIAFK